MSVKKIVDWFIPDHAQTDDHLYLRAKSSVVVSFALGIASIIYGGLYAVMHHPEAAAAIIVLVITMILPAPLIMRLTGSVKIAGNLITLGMFLVQFYLSFTSDGIYGQNVGWWATVPILATLLAGFGYGIFWGSMSAAALITFYIMKVSGYTFDSIPVTPSEDLVFRLIVYVGLVAIVMAFTLLFEGLKNSAFRKSKRSYEQLKDTFLKITENAEALANSLQELTDGSEQIGKNAADSLEKVSRMVEGTGEVNQSIHNLASSINEISAHVQDISANTGEAAEVSEKSVTLVDSVNKMIAKMDENNKEIGEMTSIITDIAFQTNLLALNAAIEAARAGEAGRGFAVVAGAVRTLSLEASEAANKISDKIKSVQEDTEISIDTIKQVNETIIKFHELMNVIAVAVKEQTATITDMSQNAGKAADETSRIAERSQSVSESSESTSNGISDILSATKEMSHLAERLKGLTQNHGAEDL